MHKSLGLLLHKFSVGMIVVLLLLPGLLTGCGGGKDDKGYSQHRAEMEVRGAQLLSKARSQLASGQIDGARATIERMRRECYLAITARYEGILLMDSVDLFAARRDLQRADSVMRHNPKETKAGRDAAAAFEEACQKVQFYERKIQFDNKHQGADKRS